MDQNAGADTRPHQDCDEALSEMYEAAEFSLYQDFVMALQGGGAVSTPAAATKQTPINALLRAALDSNDGDAILDQLRAVLSATADGRPDVASAAGLLDLLGRTHAARHASEAVAEMVGEGAL